MTHAEASAQNAKLPETMRSWDHSKKMDRLSNSDRQMRMCTL